MESVLVVGSGASGVHFALSLLKKGYLVSMLDVGWEKPAGANPNDSFKSLKANLDDPAAYFLGNEFEALVLPSLQGDYVTKYYGFPPSKNHVFTQAAGFDYRSTGFVPLLSFAQGGLAEAWTGGAYPFNDHDLKEYPFKYSDIEPFYSEVARRIGLIGANDDMARFFPLHGNLLEPLLLDENSQLLVAEYHKNKTFINDRLQCYLGRSRVTTQSIDSIERKGCTYCGRCLWGCPSESLYTPSITLRECSRYPNFNYIPGMYVNHFRYGSDGRVVTVVAESVHDRSIVEYQADRYALAAGTMSSSKIYLDSIYRHTGQIVKLTGLMDNRQILIPFVNLKMMGRSYNPQSYQYHQLAIGLENPNKPEEYLHGQITTLKTALVHPVIQNLPFDTRTSISVFRNLRSGLGVVNLNLFDRRREDNYLSLQVDNQNNQTKLVINYSPTQEEPEIIQDAVRRTKKLLWRLKCIVPPGVMQIRPMGASVHYSGVMPMSDIPAQHRMNKYCQSFDFNNLYIVDGSGMPFLPAKNITFTLMANAVRVAENMF